MTCIPMQTTATNAGDPMAILMGDAFERNIGRPHVPQMADVKEAYDFDIVVGGRNATFFELGEGVVRPKAFI